MMYTPNHSSRRPRPPGSIAHRPQASTETQPAMSILKPGPLASLVSSTSLGSLPESPLSGHDRKRKDVHQDRIIPQDLANVSLDLDISATSNRPANAQMQSSDSVPSVASLHSLGEVQPSPPPPYGGMAPDSIRSPSIVEAPTPPMQDSGLPSQESSRVQEDMEDVEEDLRAQRASDAARALGLNIDFEDAQLSPKSGNSSDSMSEGSMRAKMREMKRQMKRREQELVMAAQFAEEALQTQEQLIAYLPPHLIASISSGRLDTQTQHLRAPTPSPIPSLHSLSRGLSSSSSRSDMRLEPHQSPNPSRPFRTVRQSDKNLPFPLHQRSARPRLDQQFVSRLPTRSTVPTLQQEVADERISVLEQALLDARESEENQRKVAGRLRKEMEKQQRHAERTEDEMVAREVDQLVQSQTRTPRGHSRDSQSRRRREATPDKAAQSASHPGGYGWGSTAYPSFPNESSFRTKINVTPHDTEEEPDLGDVTGRMRPMSPDVSRGMSTSSIRSYSQSSSHGLGASDSVADRSGSIRTPSMQPRTTSRLSRSAAPESRKIRAKVSQSNFLEPTASRSRSSSPAAYSSAVSGQSSSSQSGETARISAPPSTRSSSFRRSPWPSPHPSPIHLDEAYGEYPFPTLQSTLRLEVTPRPSLSPAFASLSQRMENMRAFVSSALDPTSTLPRARGRTLGSELGDESSFWDISMKAIEQTLMRVTKPDGSDTEETSEDVSRLSEEILRQCSEEPEVTVDQSFLSDGDGEGQTPAPLPPHISAALNSLALALAPATVSPLDTKLSEGERSTLMDKLSKSLPRIKWALDIVSPLAGKGVPLPDATLPGPSRDKESSSDPWSNDRRTNTSHLGGRKAEYRLSLPLPPRPSMVTHASSDGSIALAHRRRSSQQVPTLQAIQLRKRVSMVQSEFSSMEMQTIPGRLVHDFICLMAIMMEFVECTVVIVFRVVIDVRYNRRSSIGMDKRSRSQRYYL